MLLELLVVAIGVAIILDSVYAGINNFDRGRVDLSGKVIYAAMRDVCSSSDPDAEVVAQPVYLPAESYWKINSDNSGKIELVTELHSWLRSIYRFVNTLTGSKLNKAKDVFSSTVYSTDMPESCDKAKELEKFPDSTKSNPHSYRLTLVKDDKKVIRVKDHEKV